MSDPNPCLPFDGRDPFRTTPHAEVRRLPLAEELVREPVPIGAGGNSRLFRLDTSAGALTLKVLRPSLARYAQHRARFLEEALLLRRLRRVEGVPRFAGSGRWQGQPVIAYQHVTGVSLQRFMSAAPSRGLPPLLAVEMTVGLLNVLCQLHHPAVAVTHGDISLENVLLDRQRRIWLIDFGSAAPADASCRRPGSLAVKPRCLSPEQAKGHPWAEASDLYQVGLVFYRLLTGRHLNPGRVPARARVFAANPPPVDYRGVHPALRTFLANLLDPDPRNRWSAAPQARDVLQWIHAELEEAQSGRIQRWRPILRATPRRIFKGEER